MVFLLFSLETITKFQLCLPQKREKKARGYTLEKEMKRFQTASGVHLYRLVAV
ncbi:hypothetical protein [uncultured Bilophila sp.]|uniref:hypothetical protein n=1 Tax=uncultured Bilophila sp. TaxID=529385 RepID=UPI0025FF5C0B|nr:hypothetical protein [uncultured Bilophila sp.]